MKQKMYIVTIICLAILCVLQIIVGAYLYPTPRLMIEGEIEASERVEVERAAKAIERKYSFLGFPIFHTMPLTITYRVDLQDTASYCEEHGLDTSDVMIFNVKFYSERVAVNPDGVFEMYVAVCKNNIGVWKVHSTFTG